MLDKDTSRAAGAKGGTTKSVAKRLAAQDNGRRGGRPSSRCLAERILDRKISAADEKLLRKAWDQLYAREQQQMLDYFGVGSIFGDILASGQWKIKKKHLPSDIELFVDKFELAAKHYLKTLRTVKLKPYVVEWRPSDNPLWEAAHGRPYPPRKVKIYFRNLPYFAYFEDKFKRGEPLTVEDITQAGGAAWHEKRATAAIAWLEAEYSKTS